jgi:hypothetical protein
VIGEIELTHDPDRVSVAAAADAPVARSCLAIRVEKVVEVNTIDVVALNDIDDCSQDCLARRGNAGVDPLLPAVSTNPLSVRARDVIARGANATVERRAERIEPGVYLRPRACASRTATASGS